MLNFVICDDNLNILNKLEKMLTDIFNNNKFSGIVSFKSPHPSEVLDFVKSNTVDVVLLDINFKGKKSGLDLAEELRKDKKNLYLIFTTGHLEYALVAYKYKTFDYIAKPITYDRLEDSIIRLFDDVNSVETSYLKIDKKNTMVDISEICYIKRDAMKIIFHTPHSDFDTYSSFNKIQCTLPKNFIRCHKSYIANINKIKYIDPPSNTITFSDGHTCEIGPKYKSEFMEALQKHGHI